MFLSYHVRVSEWINPVWLPEFRGTSRAWNRRNIWDLLDCNGTRTHNHLVHKRTLNHFVKLGNWLSCVVSTYLYGAVDCSCYHVMYAFQSWSIRYSCMMPRNSLPEAGYLKFKWLQRNSNPQPIDLEK